MRIELPDRGLHLEAEIHGNRADPAVILIMGLAMQLVAWPEEMIEALTSAGFQVIVFDNRDCGLSGTHLATDATAAPRAMLAQLLGQPFKPAYRLSDMAADTLALADALELESFHLVGVSLGGMIAQTLAARHPDRVTSLVSIMSNAGPDTAPWPKLKILPRFMRRPPRWRGHEARINQTVSLLKALGHLHDPDEISRVRSRVARAVDRAWRPDGITRQLLASLADRNRSNEVARIQCPTLIIHGSADPLIKPIAAHTLQHLIPHADLEIIEGMGHYLPQANLPEINGLLVRHLMGAKS